MILMCAALCFASACGNEAENEASDGAGSVQAAETPSDASENAESTPPEEIGSEEEKTAGYVCAFDNGVSIEMGALADSVISGLGDPLNYAEAPSCIHEGTDKVYTFDGYTVTTSPDENGNNRIYEVSLLSDIVALESGVTIGSAMDKVVSVFGEEYTEQFGVLQYSLEGANVSVVLDGDSYVTGLVFTANAE